MDLDLAFVAAVLAEGKPALRHAIDRGIEAKHLFGDSARAYEFLLDYYKTYQHLPTSEIVEGKTGISIPPVAGDAKFFAEEILNRRLQSQLIPTVKDWVGFIEAAKPRDLLDDVETTARTIRQEYQSSRVELITKLGDEVWQDYLKMKAGQWGIEIPWPTLNEHTLGMWPEDFILFASRSGIGKSWAGIMLSRHAWLKGKRVLFVTTEMSRINVARRFLAIHLKLPYKPFRRGLLGTNVEVVVEPQPKELLSSDGFYIVGGGFNFTFEALEASIEECEPELLVLDGAYLMKAAGTSRTEKAAGVFDELKRIAKRRRIPLVATSQFNREAKVDIKDSLTLDRLALTDVASWNADVVVSLNRTRDQEKDHKIEFKMLKNREGILGEPINAWWNFESMTFDEIPATGGGEADEFGTGLKSAPPPAKPGGTPYAPF